MLAAAERNPRPFDCLLVDDTSRFARDLPYALTRTDILDFLGVEIQFVAQGINSRSDQFRTLMTLNGMIDEQYSTSLAQKTKRGLEGTAERGFHTGSRCFGYQPVPIESPDKRDAYMVGQSLWELFCKLSQSKQQPFVVSLRCMRTEWASERLLRP
jgi:DNA invertase Pin-like site-specific DNA recombinase